MVSPDQLYAVIVAGLLLFALGVSLRVLRRIVREGVEREREWQTGEMDRYTEDEEYDRVTTRALDDAEERMRLTCPECGAENDPEFRYCRRCTASL